MPYRSIVDLPSAVSDHLPIHAQDIFLAAFNNASTNMRAAPTASRPLSASPADAALAGVVDAHQ